MEPNIARVRYAGHTLERIDMFLEPRHADILTGRARGLNKVSVNLPYFLPAAAPEPDLPDASGVQEP